MKNGALKVSAPASKAPLSAERAGYAGHASSGRTLVRRHHGHRVGLARGHVHLRTPL
jgi:hypothetical protein